MLRPTCGTGRTPRGLGVFSKEAKKQTEMSRTKFCVLIFPPNGQDAKRSCVDPRVGRKGLEVCSLAERIVSSCWLGGQRGAAQFVVRLVRNEKARDSNLLTSSFSGAKPVGPRGK